MPILGRSKPQRDDASQSGEPSYDLAEVQQIAEQGRRLAIYDRATGLYAYWYLQLRGEEELSRAIRHNKPLHLMSIWAPTPEAIERVTSALKSGLREHDLAGYLNNGHFVVLLTETAKDGADLVRQRLAAELGDGFACVAAGYPDDGATFDALLEAARTKDIAERPDGRARHAAA